MPKINVTVPHTLGQAEAASRLVRLGDFLKGQHGDKGTRVAAVVVHDPDPFAHLTPAERYAQAIQRRDAMKSASTSSPKSSL